MWECLRHTGTIVDINLPMKRDKRNKRYGFVKTTSESEAGEIILNVKEQGGLTTRIKMSINENVKQKMYSVPEARTAGTSDTKSFNNKTGFDTGAKPSGASAKKAFSQNALPLNHTEVNELGTKMFEYIEAQLVDDEIMQGLYDTKIGISWSDETSVNLQDKIDSVGVEKIKVVGLSNRKFILKSEREDI